MVDLGRKAGTNTSRPAVDILLSTKSNDLATFYFTKFVQRIIQTNVYLISIVLNGTAYMYFRFSTTNFVVRIKVLSLNNIAVPIFTFLH